MAAASYLTLEQINWARDHFGPPDTPNQATLGADFSRWLADRLWEKISHLADWIESKPIVLGSWGRGELCPRSDIDLLFLGEESKVRSVMQNLQEIGLKVRSRLPEDPRDWSKGVEAFDVLALLRARAFDSDSQDQLKLQQQNIFKRHVRMRSLLRQAIAKERKARQTRFDSIANFLEPNIKYGPGGLRDLQQALDLKRLFAGKFPEDEDLERRCLVHRGYLLAVRQRLQLIGGGDIIEGPLQAELSAFFGFLQVNDFMRDLQVRLSDIHFFASWVFYRSRLSLAALRDSDAKLIRSGRDALTQLEEDPSVLTQKKIRDQVHAVTLPAVWGKSIRVNQSIEFLEGIMDSHLLDLGLPDLERVRGLVQLDHYHRFTVDAHIRQALRVVKRVHNRPSRLGLLSPWARQFKTQDWNILLWTALFHDLGKGRKGDHSTLGKDLVASTLPKLGLTQAVTKEIGWMVENHLLLSTAAFRMNVQDPKTWKLLQDKGAVGQRLIRLGLFTAVDIQATNPEAWTKWKERLLFELLKVILSPQTSSFLKLQSDFRARAGEWIEGLDPALLSLLPAKVLLSDLKTAAKGQSLAPKVIRTSKGEIWIRFHENRDRRGQFLDFVAKLFAVGCSIRQSSVQTLKGIGVYDWFQVRTRKSPQHILKQLNLLEDTRTIMPPEDLKFQRIELVSQTEEEAVISFRGVDQRGMLLAAARALFEADFSIRWAKVHTWGKQVDDIICVRHKPSLERDLVTLRSQLGANSAASY